MKTRFINLKKVCIKNKIIFIFSSIFIIGNLFFLNYITATPSGASITIINSSGFTADSPTAIEAIAGNVTEIVIGGVSPTQSWQGYYGSAGGVIELADSDKNIMYNWSMIVPKGEVFASRNSSILWGNVQCFNFTATGNFSDDSLNRGNTSQYGMNVTQLENQYNINASDVDGVNQTFNLMNHPNFYVGSLEFNQNQCPNTKLFNATGTGSFDEVLLYSPDNKDVIFTSIINSAANGFDNVNHDFEMMVLEDGHFGDSQSSTYYFYMELG